MKPIPHNSIFSFLAVIFVTAGVAQAETIRLKSGQTIEGTVVERAEDSIKVDIGLGIPVTYYLDEIESSPMPSPAPEPKTTQSPDVPSAIKPVPVATAPAPMMQKIEKKFPLYTTDIASLPHGRRRALAAMNTSKYRPKGRGMSSKNLLIGLYSR